MPVYEKKFSESKPISAYDPKKVKCPKCRRRRVERRWSTVHLETARKS